MNLRQVTTPAAVALLALAPAAVSADAFNDTFNAYTPGVDFSDTTDWDHVGSYNVNITLQAAEDESPFSAVTDGLAAKYTDTSTGSGSARGFSVAFAAQDSTRPLTVEFDYKVIAAGHADINPSVNLLDSGGDFGAYLQLFATDDQGNAFLANRLNPGATLLTDAPVALDAWYHVKLDVDPVNTGDDTYSVTITPFGGSSVTVNGLAFRTGVTEVAGLRFLNAGSNETNGSYVIDNVQVVPEPGSLGLILPLAASMLFRRRRDRQA